MPQPLFEVEGLRIAVVDTRRVARDELGPGNDDGEQVASGWVEILSGVSYAVHEGEVLGIVGESGSGKSLMLMGAFGLLSSGAQVIGGITRYRDHAYQPSRSWSGKDDERYRMEGEKRRVADVSAARRADDAWRKLIGVDVGFLFQDPVAAWTPDVGIGEQSGEALAEHTDLTTEQIEERVLDALGEVNLSKSRRLFGAFRHELSRGMAQRAMLAAALTKAPHLLIADEPLTGLDPLVAGGVMELILDLRARRGMAMLFVTHDLAAVARVADRVAVVYGGEIVEQAPVDDIYHRPKHPYTAGLLGSIPGVTPGRLRPIEGEAPLLVDVDRDRCVFASRCEHATEICRSEAPGLSVAGSAEVRCHHATELDLPGING